MCVCDESVRGEVSMCVCVRERARVWERECGIECVEESLGESV